jgi:hypothetical protein
MFGHFGIRITDADKNKLLGELDAMTVISTIEVMCMAVRWRRSPMILVEHWPGSMSRLGFEQPRLSQREYLSRLRAGAAYRRCGAGPCGAAHDRPANLDIPPGRKACRNDDPDSDGSPEDIGHTCW